MKGSYEETTSSHFARHAGTDLTRRPGAFREKTGNYATTLQAPTRSASLPLWLFLQVFFRVASSFDSPTVSAA